MALIKPLHVQQNGLCVACRDQIICDHAAVADQDIIIINIVRSNIILFSCQSIVVYL